MPSTCTNPCWGEMDRKLLCITSRHPQRVILQSQCWSITIGIKSCVNAFPMRSKALIIICALPSRKRSITQKANHCHQFMPRIIPRLLKALREAPYKKETLPDIPPAKKKRQSLWKPNFPQHNFTPAGRTSSVLLDELNPLVHKIQFRRHKRMPPRVRTNRKVDPNHNTSSDPPRRMTVQEREWNASPYCAS